MYGEASFSNKHSLLPEKGKKAGRLTKQQLSTQRPCVERFQPWLLAISHDSQHTLSPLLHYIPQFLPAYALLTLGCSFCRLLHVPMSMSRGHLPGLCLSCVRVWVELHKLRNRFSWGKGNHTKLVLPSPQRETTAGPTVKSDFQQGPCSSLIYREKVTEGYTEYLVPLVQTYRNSLGDTSWPTLDIGCP